MISEKNGKYTAVYKVNYNLKEDLETIESEIRTFLDLKEGWCGSLEKLVDENMMYRLDNAEDREYEDVLDQVFQSVFEKGKLQQAELIARKEELTKIYKLMGRDVIFDKTLEIMKQESISKDDIEEFGKKIWQSLPYEIRFNILIDDEIPGMNLSIQDKDVLYEWFMECDETISYLNPIITNDGIDYLEDFKIKDNVFKNKTR